MQRILPVSRYVAVILVAVPALGIAFLSLREGIAEPGGPSMNRAFHLLLGMAMLSVLIDALVAIRRSHRPEIIVLIGTGGFLAALLGGLLSELLGPPALALLLAGVVTWGIALVRSAGRPGPYARSFSLPAREPGPADAVYDD